MTSSIAYLFGGELKARILQTLLLNHDQAYHLRGLAAAAGVESGNALKALRSLTGAHFVKTVQDSRGVRYQAEDRSPLFEPLRELFLRSGELIADLKEVATQLPVEQVLIFGSVAKGTDTPDSDIDVLVVGDISSIEAQAAFKPTSRKHGRAVSVMAIDHETLAGQEMSEFWHDVLANKVIMLKGKKLDASFRTTAISC
jgi:predicted nucleotidyltransferase